MLRIVTEPAAITDAGATGGIGAGSGGSGTCWRSPGRWHGDASGQSQLLAEGAQVGGHVGGALVAALWILFHRAADDIVHLRREVGDEAQRAGQGFAHVLHDDADGVLRIEREAPRHALEEDDAQRVDVGAPVHVTALPPLFWRHVLWRACRRAAARKSLARLQNHGDAEVRQQHIVARAHQHVAGLDITVNDATAMREVERLRGLLDHVQRPG